MSWNATPTTRYAKELNVIIKRQDAEAFSGWWVRIGIGLV
jgi:hypothetical protein